MARSLSRRSGDDKETYPAPFIVGSGRCGTTLLRMMLDGHSELAIPHETHFIPSERTFAWLGRYRRLSKAYEALPATEEAWIHLAMSSLMLARLAQ